MGPPPLKAPAARLFRPSNSAVALSLALAAFALVLQLSSRTSVEHIELLMTGGAERDLMAMQQPKLELNAAKAAQLPLSNTAATTGDAGSSGATRRQPLPQGMGGQHWKAQEAKADGPQIGFIVTTSDSLQQIKVWISYHRAIGVTTFYIFADGQAARGDNVEVLRSIPGVTVVLRDADLRKRHENSRIWKESWLSAFFHKPCNHELFVLQSLNMEVGIGMAQKDGIDWLLHVDTDELIFPSGSLAFSLQEVLAQVPADVDTLVFPNYESLPERVDVADPFLEVTLFKKNYAHVVSDLYFKSYGTVARGNPNYFITYGNGKSAARVQHGMRPNGAHRWHSYVKTPKEWSSDQAAVLHYTYNRFSDLKSRRDRCDCAPTEDDAKRCFILPFDRMAFLEASLKNDNELMDWFKQRLVWGDPAVVNDLLKKGLFQRIYEPQLMIRGFLEADKAEIKAAEEAIKAAEQAKRAAEAGAAAAREAALQAAAQAAAAQATAQSAAAIAAIEQEAAKTQAAAAQSDVVGGGAVAATSEGQEASDAAITEQLAEAAVVGTVAASTVEAAANAQAVAAHLQQAQQAQEAAAAVAQVTDSQAVGVGTGGQDVAAAAGQQAAAAGGAQAAGLGTDGQHAAAAEAQQQQQQQVQQQAASAAVAQVAGLGTAGQDAARTVLHQQAAESDIGGAATVAAGEAGAVDGGAGSQAIAEAAGAGAQQ